METLLGLRHRIVTDLIKQRLKRVYPKKAAPVSEAQSQLPPPGAEANDPSKEDALHADI